MYIFLFSASKEYFPMIFQCLFRSFLSRSNFLFGEESLYVFSDVTLTLYSHCKYSAMKSFLCVRYPNYLQDLPLGHPFPLKSVLALVFPSVRSINPTPRQFPKPPPKFLFTRVCFSQGFQDMLCTFHASATIHCIHRNLKDTFYRSDFS